jgi:hypothetical protein
MTHQKKLTIALLIATTVSTTALAEQFSTSIHIDRPEGALSVNNINFIEAIDLDVEFNFIESLCLKGTITQGDIYSYSVFSREKDSQNQTSGDGAAWVAPFIPPTDPSLPFEIPHVTATPENPFLVEACLGSASQQNFLDGISNIDFDLRGSELVISNLALVAEGQANLYSGPLLNIDVLSGAEIVNAVGSGSGYQTIKIDMPIGIVNTTSKSLVFEFEKPISPKSFTFGATATGESSLNPVFIENEQYSSGSNVRSIVVPLNDDKFDRLLDDSVFSMSFFGENYDHLSSVTLRASGDEDESPVFMKAKVGSQTIDSSNRWALLTADFIVPDNVIDLPVEFTIYNSIAKHRLKIEAWAVLSITNSVDAEVINIPIENVKSYRMGQQLTLWMDQAIDDSYPAGQYTFEFYVRKLDSGIIQKIELTKYFGKLPPVLN